MKRKNKIIKDAGNVEAGVKFFNNAMSMSENIDDCKYSVENMRARGIELDTMDEYIFSHYCHAFEELGK